MRNTPSANDDFGGSALSFDNLTASPGPVATGNTISGNSGPSSDYTYDGGGVDPVPNALTVDRNKFHFTGPIFASYADGTTSSSVADWRLRSGLDLTSTEY